MAGAMRRVPLLLPVLILPLACGDDDVGDSPDGWRASTEVLQLGQAELQAEFGSGAEGEVSLECPDGGSFTLAGRIDDENTFDLSINYDGCQTEGVRIDGELTAVGTVEVTETSVEIAVSYRGSLQWSGAANGECGIDVDMYVAASSDGQTASGEYSFEGEICGHDARAVIEASAEID